MKGIILLLDSLNLATCIIHAPQAAIFVTKSSQGAFFQNCVRTAGITGGQDAECDLQRPTQQPAVRRVRAVRQRRGPQLCAGAAFDGDVPGASRLSRPLW